MDIIVLLIINYKLFNWIIVLKGKISIIVIYLFNVYYNNVVN